MKTRWSALVTGLIFTCLSLQVLAGGGPCNYVVLYDQTDTNSVAVANYYQQVRDIPERNMVPYTFFPSGKTAYTSNDLWSLTLYLRQVIQDRGLTGRFNGIAVAGTVPLMGKTDRLDFQTGLYYAPNLTGSADYIGYNSGNGAFASIIDPITRELRDDTPFVRGSVTNFYWPISFVGFTGVNGNTPDEVFALLDRSKIADGQRPDGMIYWQTNADIRSITREWEMNYVLPIWDARGIRYTVGEGSPTGRRDISGQFIGIAQADAGINGNAYLPGSWADHLTSNGGNLNSLLNGQSSACAWIRSGAYGAAGTCSEPYAIAGKFPHAHIHTHLRAGASQAEAFWLSLQTPYEILMVGDPLLQAWAQIPQVSISSPADGATLSGTATISTSASTASPDGLESQYELAVDGHIVRIGSTNETISAAWTGSGFSLNTATLADGWHELRVIAYNNNLIRTQGEDSRTVFVNNSSQSVALTGPGTLEYTSNGTFTVTLNGIANATNVTLQANGRTFATLSPSGGSTNISASLFGYQGHTKLYALAWLSNGKQVWSAPLDVSLSWAPVPATNVTPGASIAQIRYFSSTTATNFDWDSTMPDAVTNFAGPVLAEGFHTAIKYRAYSVDTNVFAPANYTGTPGFDSTMYFLAPVDGLYEFMIDDTSLANILMDVDGQRIRHGLSTSDGNIKTSPVKLAAGFHPVRLRFQVTKSDFQADLFFRGGISPGNMNCDYYSNYLNLRMNEFVCFGPAITNNAAPVITVAPLSTPAKSTTATLSVGAVDPDGDSNALTYSWAKIDGPGQVKVYSNAVSTCFTNLATFSRAGDYRLRVMVSDGLSVTATDFTASVSSVYSTITLSPANLTIRTGASAQFYVEQKDQFGTVNPDSTFIWSVIGGGTVTSNGLYTAGGTGTDKLVATTGGYSTTNTITVIDNFPPTISSVSLLNYGDHLRCSVSADDDLGTNNLTYTWVNAGTNTITFTSNGTATNPANGYFTRFGTYKVQVGVTDSGGATTWGGTNTITVGPTINGNTVIDTAGNGDGRLDPNESANIFVDLYRGADYGTNLPISAVLTVTNTPGMTVVQPNSAYPSNVPLMSISSNLVPFGISASSNLVDKNTRDLVLTVTIGGASGDLPFSLPAGAPYSMAQTSGVSIVSGTTDVGIHSALWGGTNVSLPFAYSFGGQSFTSVFVNGNGILQFSSSDKYNYYGTIPQPGFTNIMAVHWDLLRLDGTGAGIFTSVSGTAPNRIFNIEWRAVRYFATTDVINCEARLFEAEPRVDMIYGTIGNSGADADVGVQVTPASYIVYSEYLPVLTNGLKLSFILKNETGAPTAHFTASPTSGWAPLPVTFSDTSTGGITNRFWDFGDGTTLNTTAISVAHTYTSAGNKTVQLIVSGPDGVSTNTQVDCVQVTIAVAPAAGFTVSTNAGTVPLAVTFTDTSTGDITNRFWSFGDGATTNTTATTVLHAYTSVGTNTVQLIVRGPVGVSTNTQAGAVTVTLPPAPVANFSASPVSGVAPLAVTFTDTSTGTITNRFWSFGDGGTTNTTATSVSHTYTVAGTNTVQLIVNGPGGSSTNTQANLISVVAALPLYKYDGFDYTDGAGLRYSPGYATSGSPPQPTNRAGSLAYSGLPSSTGGKLELAGFKSTAAGSVTYKMWSAGNPDTNLFASFILNVQSVGVIQSNQGIFSIRQGVSYFMITNNASDPLKYNVGLWNKNGGTTWVWDNNGGSGYTAGTSYFIVMSYTNGTGASIGSQVWVNPPLGQSSPGAAKISMTGSYVNSPTNIYTFFNGNGVGDAANRSVIYVDELRVGPTWASVTPGTISAPAPVITSTLSATGTVNQAFSYQITADNSPSSFNATGLPSGLSVNTNSGAITGTPTAVGSNNVTISASSPGGTDSKTLVVVISAPVTDSNGNGIPDSWEQQYYGTNSVNPSALAANGVNTIYETYIAGLNPTNPASVFLISNFQPLTSQSVLQWQSASGRVYSVYWATNLLNGFQPLETNILWPQNSWTDTVHGVQAGSFYRIKVQLGQ